jgi:hypothetical protein
MLVTTNREGRVGDQLNYEYVRHVEANIADKVRHIKKEDDVIDADDALSGAGCTMLQIWFTKDTHEECAALEMEIRQQIYKIDINWEYP